MCRGGFPKHYHMKPKTTYQKRIVKLNKSVEALSENIIEWAKESAITHPAVRRKNNVTVCPMCGNAMVYAGNARKVKCLECERTLQVIEADTWKSIKVMQYLNKLKDKNHMIISLKLEKHLTKSNTHSR